eukprot:955655-Pleurochrysis_carterae.AAC.1
MQRAGKQKAPDGRTSCQMGGEEEEQGEQVERAQGDVREMQRKTRRTKRLLVCTPKSRADKQA